MTEPTLTREQREKMRHRAETWLAVRLPSEATSVSVEPEHLLALLDALDAAEAREAAYARAVRVAYAYLREPRMDGSHVPNAKDVLEAVRRDWPYKDPLEAEAAALRARAEWAEAAIRAALAQLETLDEVDWNGMGPWNGIYQVLLRAVNDAKYGTSPASERKATAATPGPWRMVALSSHYGVTHGDYRFPTVVYAHEGWDGYGNGSSRPDADYIAEADPTTILALIARVREAEARADDTADRYAEMVHVWMGIAKRTEADRDEWKARAERAEPMVACPACGLLASDPSWNWTAKEWGNGSHGHHWHTDYCGPVMSATELLAENAALRARVEALEGVLREGVEWLESRPDYTEGDAATSSVMRHVLEGGTDDR